jgi:hypothetical protein
MDRYAIKLGKEPPLFDVRVVSQTKGKPLSKRKEATSSFVPETEEQKAEINNMSSLQRRWPSRYGTLIH